MTFLLRKLRRLPRPVFAVFLRSYRSRGLLLYQKARIQLLFLGAGLVIFPILLVQDLLLEGPTHWTLYAACLGGSSLLILYAFLLRSGRQLLSGHLLLFSITGAIWFWMFLGSASTLNRLDTIFLVVAVLLLTPLITDQRGLVVHFFFNGIIHLLFLIYNPENETVSGRIIFGYGMDTTIALIMSGVVAYLLVRINERAEREILRSSDRLESLVQRKTVALQATSEALAVSRDELRRDMEMARHVQSSLLVARAPTVPGWDVAHIYRPCSLVSGDFYDYYVRDGRLVGVGLFEFSGPGVASGLITLLARSIFYRKFSAPGNPGLSQVMESANADLVQEMKNVNHYLTGTLLRLDEAWVQSVNAGHPDPLLCDANGVTRAIAETDDRHRGSFLGKEYLTGPYPALETPVADGDAILMYSDGITDAFDADENEYGHERLEKTFARTSHIPDPAQRLQAIVADVERYKGEQPFPDDLTLILLVKRAS